MKNFKKIDTHAHIYPNKIADKAVNSVKNFYGVPAMVGDGTPETLLELAKPHNVEKIVVHSVATTPKQVESINNFICEEARAHKEFLPFATLHPDMTAEELRSEVARIKAMSMKGIKLHPDCQAFPIDGKENRKILDALDGSLPILYHTGDKRKNFSNPKQMIVVAKEYPHLTFIAAHFGGYSEWENCYGYAGIDNVYFDTSSTFFALPVKDANALIDALGSNRFMFGTDYPMWGYADELARLEALNLPDATLEDIFYNNAKRILKIEQ